MLETDPLGLWGIGDPLPQGVVDFSAGFGDDLSCGLTSIARNAVNVGSGPNFERAKKLRIPHGIIVVPVLASPRAVIGNHRLHGLERLRATGDCHCCAE